jgi:epoxyqueuosine reductase
VCQDVCPWNRAVERRRGAGAPSADSTPTVSLREWLERDGAELVADLDRLYVPRNDPKWLRRNALVAAGNVGTAELVPFVEPYAGDDDPVLRETAAWALGQIAARTG